MMTKVCTVCKQLKPETEFKKRESKRGGRRGTCNSCRNISRRKTADIAETRIKIKNAKKEGRRFCVSCGETKNPASFQKGTHTNKCKICQAESPNKLIVIFENRELRKEGKKRCRKCGGIKVLGSFYGGHKPTGSNPECKECIALVTPTTIYRRKNISLAAKGLRHCIDCQEDKPLENYTFNKHGTAKSRRCKLCASARKTLKKRERVHLTIFRRIKRNSKGKGWAVDVTLEDIKALPIPSHCPCCSKEMEYEDYSIDRIDNSYHYIVGNLAIICHKCNTLKRDGLLQDFENIIAYIKSLGNVNLNSYSVHSKTQNVGAIQAGRID